MNWMVLPANPGKPRYNPFTDFVLTKSFLREKIKEMNHEANDNLKIIRQLGEDPKSEWFTFWWEEKQLLLAKRIKAFQWRLGDFALSDGKSISSNDIDRARGVDIRTYFIGKLRTSSKNSTGLCPFHQEKNPSFSIYDEGRRFKCFSCGAGGDTIDFVQRSHCIGFIEAIKLILNLK